MSLNVIFQIFVLYDRWMSLRMEFIGNCVILFSALFAVISRGKIESGFVGLSMVYALQARYYIFIPRFI